MKQAIHITLKFCLHLFIILAMGLLIAYLVYPELGIKTHLNEQWEYLGYSITAAGLITWISEKKYKL